MPVPSELLTFARELRQSQTDAEVLLWHLLRGRRFCGLKFRRQVPVGGYILDFYCHSAKVAIEVDGGGHNVEEQRLYDAERTKVLEETGLRVLRFWSHEVLNSLDEVLAAIYAHLMVGKRKG